MGSLRVGHDWETVTHSSLKSLKLKDQWNLRTKSVKVFIRGSRFRVCARIWVFPASSKERPNEVFHYQGLRVIYLPQIHFWECVSGTFPLKVPSMPRTARWQCHSWKQETLALAVRCLSGSRALENCRSGWRQATHPRNAAVSLQEEVPAVKAQDGCFCSQPLSS